MPPKGKRMSSMLMRKKIQRDETPPSTPEGPSPLPSDDNTSRSRSRSREVSPRPTQESISQAPKKRAKVAALNLAPEQQEELADWLKENDFIFVKDRSQYKDTAVKKRLWEEAKTFGVDSRVLITWYESVRTKIGKLLDAKSSSATKELSDRDQYLKDNFGFLGQPHRPPAFSGWCEHGSPSSRQTGTTTATATAAVTATAVTAVIQR